MSARAARSQRSETSIDQRICVVDDDERIRRILRHIFETAGYAVAEAASEAELLGVLKSQNIALVTLDLTLRNEDGLSIARNVRSFSDVPIIMVTARGEDIDRIVGLEIGADDYIAKPFNDREVLARVRAVLRRTQPRPKTPAANADEIRFGNWVLDMSGHELRALDGQVCRLTSAEYKLLEAFVRHPGRVLSRDFLIDVIGGVNAEPLERSIDTTVSRLRHKIEIDASSPKLVKTVRGAGYRFTGTLRN